MVFRSDRTDHSSELGSQGNINGLVAIEGNNEDNLKAQLWITLNPYPNDSMRGPEKVAEGLLGNILVRKLGAQTLSGLIVETEAYYGSEDPASRARHGIDR